MKKLKKLELIEAPISEMDQEMMENILAGWICTSFGPTGTCLTYNCTVFKDKIVCGETNDSETGNYCITYYAPGGGSYCADFVEHIKKD